MFKKVLIAEDIDTINLGLVDELSRHFKFKIEHAKYCDDALLKFKKALVDQQPFDLLISDLSFKKDHRETILNNGEELARVVRSLDPNIKIIIYSIEDRPQTIQSLFDRTGINGYVCKARESSKEIIATIKHLVEEDCYIPPSLQLILKQSPIINIGEYDIVLLGELAEGNGQVEISKNFKAKGLKPASMSSIEKRINKLRAHFNAKNTTQLVALAKDLGLI